MTGKKLLILGIRGIPAAHGGFETFAAILAPWLRDHGWDVTVYCQGSDTGATYEDMWDGIRRVHIPVNREGAVGTIEFDIKSTIHALSRPGTILTLGYNTGFLAIVLRICKRKNLINMDGLEWKRGKYSWGAKAYLWVNERFAAMAGNVLIADHPAIADHLATRVKRSKIATIPYGSTRIDQADPALLEPYGLESGKFLTLIARSEPENSILEIVRAFTRRRRGIKLAVLGNYSRDHSYQCQVLEAGNAEVAFIGGVYDVPTVASLRFHSLAYMHGHQVGGTNPSLVEALGAGNPVIGHDNRFNRWVAGDAGLYFTDVDGCDTHITQILAEPAIRDAKVALARQRWSEAFSWPTILEAYREVIEAAADAPLSADA